MRGCASIITIITELRPASVPTTTSRRSACMTVAHVVPAARAAPASIATTIGAGAFSICLNGTSPTITVHTTTYSTVQSASDPSRPNGMSRCGLRASCADVDTASNPMYAKKTTAAPRKTPLQPYAPNEPSFGGMNGCQCAGSTSIAPPPAISSTTPTLMTTMIELTVAD